MMSSKACHSGHLEGFGPPKGWRAIAVGLFVLAASPPSQGAVCPYTSVQSQMGTPAVVGSTCGFVDDLSGSCGPATVGEDASVKWTAPGTGLFTFSTVGSAVDTVVYLADDTCVGESACDYVAATGSSIVDHPLTVGQTITIVVDTADGCGDFALDITGTYCGDAVLGATEDCDDGNAQDGDFQHGCAPKGQRSGTDILEEPLDPVQPATLLRAVTNLAATQ